MRVKREARIRERDAMRHLVDNRLRELQGLGSAAEVPRDIDRKIVHEMRDVYKDALREQAAGRGLRREADEKLVSGQKRWRYDDTRDEDIVEHVRRYDIGMTKRRADEELASDSKRVRYDDTRDEDIVEHVRMYEFREPASSRRREPASSRRRASVGFLPDTKRTKVKLDPEPEYEIPSRGVKRERDDDDHAGADSKKMVHRGIKRERDPDRGRSSKKMAYRAVKRERDDDDEFEAKDVKRHSYLYEAEKRRMPQSTARRKVRRVRSSSPLPASVAVRRRAPDFEDSDQEEEFTGIPFKNALVPYSSTSGDDSD